jgi:hypothetical protein
LPEEDLLFGVGHGLAGAGDGCRQGVGAPGGRARGDRGVPAAQLRERRQVQRGLVVGIDPRVTGHVGDGVVVAGNECASLQPLVEHAEQAFRFAAIALDRIGHGFRRVHAEMAVLPGHRSESADLPEQPLQHRVATAQVAGQEAAGLFGEVLQDRARLEHRDRCTAARRRVVDHRRHLVVGRNRQERRLELRALADVDRNDAVVDVDAPIGKLLEQQGDLVAVGGRPVVEIDHVQKPRRVGTPA